MAKTRSQTGEFGIKKEEREDRKPTMLLNGITNTRSNNRITKRKPSKNNTSILPAQQVKVEEDTDNKSLLKSSSNYSKRAKRPYVSQEQINQLIDYVVNDNMNVAEASRNVKISPITARHYYNEYENDPEKKIPVPRHQRVHAKGFLTQEHIENLIRYIVDDKMSIPKASAKANMACKSGRYYYNKYLEDSNRAIPVPKWCRYSTQDQKNEFLGYVVNDKMSIRAASKKAKMSADTGRKYYHNYFKSQNPDISTPSHITTPKLYTQEQINDVISYIFDDKMTIHAASKKANMCHVSASKHYHQYLKDHNMEIPVSKCRKRYTQDEIKQFIRYIVDDKMNIMAASEKASMGYSTGQKYYRQYLKENSLPSPILKYMAQGQKKMNSSATFLTTQCL